MSDTISKRRSLFRRLRNGIGYLFFLGVVVLLLLELCFRYYLIDFYSANFYGLNSKELLENKVGKIPLLVMGDSFTADPRSYIAQLREQLPDHQVINSAVPGTCVKQSSLMFPSRNRHYAPQIFLYQLYVGNDLLEFRHPTKGANISMLRRCYWWLSDRLWVLGYLNSRLPHLRQAIHHDLPTDYDPKVLADFSPQRYSARSKMHFRAEPFLIENSALLQGARRQDMEHYIPRIEQMFQPLPADCSIILLVLPHCMQLNARYRDRMLQLGAQLQDTTNILQTNYPFFNQLQQHFGPDPRIQLINALPILRVAEEQASVYYDNDPHLNRAGQQIIGDTLATLLLKMR
ncbi:MAG: hypothetical protein AAGG75_23460 [Bacteroidota bacterium]